jgi:replication-associated recombination protein RarA
MHKVKNELRLFARNAAMNIVRDNLNMQSIQLSPVIVLTGNPGTGKTSSARIIAGKKEGTFRDYYK